MCPVSAMVVEFSECLPQLTFANIIKIMLIYVTNMYKNSIVLFFFNKGDGSSKSKKLKKDKKHKKHKNKEKGEILKSYHMPFIYLSTMKCEEI